MRPPTEKAQRSNVTEQTVASPCSSTASTCVRAVYSYASPIAMAPAGAMAMGLAYEYTARTHVLAVDEQGDATVCSVTFDRWAFSVGGRTDRGLEDATLVVSRVDLGAASWKVLPLSVLGFPIERELTTGARNWLDAFADDFVPRRHATTARVVAIPDHADSNGRKRRWDPAPLVDVLDPLTGRGVAVAAGATIAHASLTELGGETPRERLELDLRLQLEKLVHQGSAYEITSGGLVEASLVVEGPVEEASRRLDGLAVATHALHASATRIDADGSRTAVEVSSAARRSVDRKALPAGEAARPGEPGPPVLELLDAPDGKVRASVSREDLEHAALLTKRYRDAQGKPEEATRALEEALRLVRREGALLLRCIDTKTDFSRHDEERVQETIRREAEPYRGVDGIRRALDQIGVPWEYYLARKRSALLVGKLLAHELPRRVPPPEEVLAYYDAHGAEFVDSSGKPKPFDDVAEAISEKLSEEDFTKRASDYVSKVDAETPFRVHFP